MQHIETLLHELSRWFLAPVLGLIVLLFVYALYAAGGFSIEFLQRRRAGGARPLHRVRARHASCELADLELHIVRELEGLRLATRTAPLLGLVATMIPLGPALAGVANGQMQTVGQQVGVAFAAVIVALLAASTCYAILIVRRRWRLDELRAIEKSLASASKPVSTHRLVAPLPAATHGAVAAHPSSHAPAEPHQATTVNGA